MSENNAIIRKNFEIRLFLEGDENSILGLLQSAFPNWAKVEKGLDYWRWKFFDTPLGALILVAESDGKVIGVSHNINLNLKIGNCILLSQFSCDVTTHIDYRGMGVIDALISKIHSLRTGLNVKIGYATSSHPAIIREWTKLGRPPFPHTVSYMIRIRDVDLHLKMRPVENPEFIRTGVKALTGLHKIRRTLKGKNRTTKTFDVEFVDQFDDLHDIFWNNVEKHYNFISDRSSRFLNWRYLDPRGDEVIVKHAVKNGVVLGYIVYKVIKNDEYSEGYIVDLLAISRRNDVVNSLLEEACDYFDSNDVNVVYYLVIKDHPYQGLSVDHGFIDSRRGPFITLQVANSAPEFEALKISHPSRVYLAYCDLY